MTDKVKVLITVKTYPTISRKYGELVCTAGMKEDGSWIRIYPIPFTRFENYKKFSKYTWININLVRNSEDPRPESYKSIGWDFDILDQIDTRNNWEERKRLVFKNKIFRNLSKLIEEAKKNRISLALFKPTKILDFKWEEVDREWDNEKLDAIERERQQRLLFFPEGFKKDFKKMPKLPYRFSYAFSDEDGKKSKLMLEDWEVGQLFWNCKNKYGNEAEALKKVKQKYLDEFVSKRDLYFYLGTTRQFHSWASNPFIIIGTFHPPKEIQKSFNFEI